MFLFTKKVFMFSSFKKYLIQEVLAENKGVKTGLFLLQQTNTYSKLTIETLKKV